MRFYSLHGLTIGSEVDLPALPGEEEKAVAFFRFSGEPPRLPRGSRVWQLDLDDAEAVFSVQDAGSFHIRQGAEVRIRALPGVPHNTLRVFLMGSVLGMLLHQRGMLVAHASAIQFGGGAALFLGESGFGKSSIAAAMYMKGYTLVADDLAPLQVGPVDIRIAPGFPRFKLYPEIAAAVGIDPRTMHYLDRVEKKLGHWIRERFAAEALPVRFIFVLDRNAERELSEDVSGSSIIELVKHSYPTRLCRGGGPQHFMKCAEVSRRVQMFRLRSFRSLQEIGRVVEVLEERLGRPREEAVNVSDIE